MNKAPKPTIRDVAQTGGVSVGWVSGVLNRNETVRPEIRDRVHQAIETLGFSPNHAAQSMRSRTTRPVGCIIREISIPPLAAFVRAAHDVLHEAGYALLLTNSEGNVERERELLKRLSRRQADGMMLGLYTPSDPNFDDFLLTLNVPIVVVDRDTPAWADAVMADHHSSTPIMTDRLLSLGHRRIAILTGRDDMFPAPERLRGYRPPHQPPALPLNPAPLPP